MNKYILKAVVTSSNKKDVNTFAIPLKKYYFCKQQSKIICSLILI